MSQQALDMRQRAEDTANTLAEWENIGKLLIQLTTDVTKDFEKISVLVRNQTEETKTLKSRQAISGAFQAISLVILFLWLVTLMVRAIIRCVTKKQEARQKQMLEMMEKSLQERKTKRRAAAKPGPSDK